MKCDLCGKLPQTGCAVSHSKRHTKRQWLGNIHPTTMLINGQMKRLKLCTRCIRTQHKVSTVK
ncbi:MAG: 50S ribosomal protein L28 [Dehalococcoidales bacterium]|nr:50S ribosomal protein L28 [Dehalococcoidales bacterium]